MTIEISTKMVIKANAPTKFKREVGRLLNELMKDHYIMSTNSDEFTDNFKSTFKSNLYYIIDNYFEVKEDE